MQKVSTMQYKVVYFFSYLTFIQSVSTPFRLFTYLLYILAVCAPKSNSALWLYDICMVYLAESGWRMKNKMLSRFFEPYE